ncbi:MAG: NUDIX hydrolase [Acetobacteraceae bacterium]|nr:NUDIX hydrolase [Acetobacteraceae bacterium]
MDEIVADGFVVHDLAPELMVRVTRPMPPLPAEIDARVEALWRQAASRVEAGGAGRLFNGRVFSADRITPAAITGHMTEFRRIVAQMEDPSLFPALALRPLAVGGVLRCRDGVAVGRRPPAAVYQPGMWQLPPAGSVDASALGADGTIDLVAQVLTELREELGLPATSVTAPCPICVVEHPGSHVSDLGMALTTTVNAQAVLDAHRTDGNGEYDPLRVIGFQDIAGFVAEAGDLLVPPARIFLERLRLLP